MIGVFCILTILGCIAYVWFLCTRGIKGSRGRDRLRVSRRLAGTLLLIALMLCILAGTYLFDAKTQPTLYVFSWGISMLLVCAVVVIAFWDLAAIQHETTVKAQKNLSKLRRDKQ